MVRKILDKTIDGVKYVITVPDNASREDEIEEFTYWIRYYKTLSERVKEARQRLEELAEDEPLIDWLLHDEGWDKRLQRWEEYYRAVTLNLLKEFYDYVRDEEIIDGFTRLFTSGLDVVMKKLMGDLKKSVEEEKEVGGEPDAGREGPSED